MKTLSYHHRLIAMASCVSALLTAGAFAAQPAAKTPETAKTPATAKATPAAPAEKAGVMSSPHTGKAWFGAIVENVDAPHGRHEAKQEVRIAKVIHGSPASLAGLKAGDILWSFDGGRLQSTAQFHKELREESPGATVKLAIYRNGKREEMKVTLGEARHTATPKSGATEHAHA